MYVRISSNISERMLSPFSLEMLYLCLPLISLLLPAYDGLELFVLVIDASSDVLAPCRLESVALEGSNWRVESTFFACKLFKSLTSKQWGNVEVNYLLIAISCVRHSRT